MNELTTAGPSLATSHPHAAAAGVEMYRGGGNAVDAAAAAMLAACVVVPWSCSLGGYGGSLAFYDAKRRAVSCVDFDSKAPYAYKPGPEQTAERWQAGYLSIGVPGVVAGLALALQKFGAKKWADVIAPAIRLAQDGFVIDAAGAKAVAGFAVRTDKTSIRAIAPDGRFPAAGERWRQPDLAALLKRLADAPAAFYQGDIPRAIVKQVRDNGGILAEEDFTRYEAREVEPITVNYEGIDLYTPPPPSAGVTTLSILKTLESFDLGERERWGATYFEVLAEAMKLCWDERRRHLGDPDFVNPPLARMLSAEAALARAARIRGGPAREPQPVPADDSCTANVVAVDADRNMVSLTATNGGGWGSRVAIAGLGLSLGHAMSRFSPDPKSPNHPAPGKRVQHNMAPLLMLRGGSPHGAVGVVGGTRIPNATAQIVVGLLDFQATPAAALAAPRLHTEGNEPLEVSRNLPDAVFNELQLMGHQLKRVAAVGGPLNAATVAADDRRTVTIAGTAAAGGVAKA